MLLIAECPSRYEDFFKMPTALFVAIWFCLTIFGCGGGGGGGRNDTSPAPINEPADEPADPPSIIFHMDESQGNLTQDVGDYDITGAISGGAQWVDGVAGSALSFETPGSQLSFNFGSMALDASKITFESWIKPVNLDYDTYYLVAGSSFSWRVTISDGHLEFWVCDGGSYPDWVRLLSWDTLLENDTWYYVAISFNGSEAQLYIDGERVAVSFGIYYMRNNGLASLYIGGSSGCCHFGDYIDSFPGIIDEIGIVYEVLSIEQIRSNFENLTSGDQSLNDPVDLPVPQDDPGVSSDTIAMFHMDEGIGCLTRDMSDSALSGKISGGALWVDGVSGKALSFENTDARLTKAMDMPAPQAFSAEAWLNIASEIPNETSLVIGADFSWKLQLNDGALEFLIYNNQQWNLIIDWDGILSDGNWHYVAVTYSGSSTKLYIDGVNVLTNPGVFQIYYGDEISIGGQNGCCALGHDMTSFPGFIDEVNVSSMVISSEEIDSRYQSIVN